MNTFPANKRTHSPRTGSPQRGNPSCTDAAGGDSIYHETIPEFWSGPVVRSGRCETSYMASGCRCAGRSSRVVLGHVRIVLFDLLTSQSVQLVCIEPERRGSGVTAGETATDLPSVAEKSVETMGRYHFSEAETACTGQRSRHAQRPRVPRTETELSSLMAELSSGVSALEGRRVFHSDHTMREALIGPAGNLCVVKWCPGRTQDGQRRRATLVAPHETSRRFHPTDRLGRSAATLPDSLFKRFQDRTDNAAGPVFNLRDERRNEKDAQ